jgi:hypothetical protein
MAMYISNNSAFKKYIKIINATIPFIIATMKNHIFIFTASKIIGKITL